jgi:hypothetical protein
MEDGGSGKCGNIQRSTPKALVERIDLTKSGKQTI